MGARKFAVALIAAGIVLRLSLLLWQNGTMVDDAYISLRYADNLIHGKGLVYNEHVRVLSTTTPLYTLWLSVLLLIKSNLDPGYVIGIANLVFFGMAAWGLWALCSRRDYKAALAVLVIFTMFVRFADNTTTGMETSAFLLAMILSLVLLERERLGWSLLVAALSMLIRPEGTLWAASLLLVAALRRMGLKPKNFLPGALVLAAWVAFGLYYYHSPIPHAMKVKSEWFAVWYHHSALAGMGNTFAALTLIDLPERIVGTLLIRSLQAVLACATAVAFIYGAKQLFEKRDLLVVFPIFFVLYLAFYLIGRGWAEFSWYGIPSGLAYTVTSVWGVAPAIGRLKRRVSPGWVTRAAVIIVVLLAGTTLLVHQKIRLPGYAYLRNSYEKAGALVDEVAKPGDRVFATEAGMIGYRARRFTYDLGGIASPEVLDLYRERSFEIPLAEVWSKFMPEFIIVSPKHIRIARAQGGLQWLEDNYETIASFPEHGVLRRRGLSAPQVPGY